MMAIFRDALVYDNGVMKKVNMRFDGIALSVFEGDVSAFDSSVVFDNIAIFLDLNILKCMVYVIALASGIAINATMGTAPI